MRYFAIGAVIILIVLVLAPSVMHIGRKLKAYLQKETKKEEASDDEQE